MEYGHLSFAPNLHLKNSIIPALKRSLLKLCYTNLNEHININTHTPTHLGTHKHMKILQFRVKYQIKSPLK